MKDQEFAQIHQHSEAEHRAQVADRAAGIGDAFYDHECKKRQSDSSGGAEQDIDIRIRGEKQRTDVIDHHEKHRYELQMKMVEKPEPLHTYPRSVETTATRLLTACAVMEQASPFLS